MKDEQELAKNIERIENLLDDHVFDPRIKKNLEQQLEKLDNTLTELEYKREYHMSAQSSAEQTNQSKTTKTNFFQTSINKGLQKVQSARRYVSKKWSLRSSRNDNGTEKITEEDLAGVQEQQCLAAEVADAISRPVDIKVRRSGIDEKELTVDLGEEELLAEFDRLVPFTAPTSSTSIQQPESQARDDLALKDLENWMAS